MVSIERNSASNFIERERELNETRGPKITWKEKLLKSALFKGLICLIIFATVVPVLMFYFLIDQNVHNVPVTHTCVVNRTFRVTCGKANITQRKCLELNCCFDVDVCFHYLPSKYSFNVDKNKENKPSYANTPYGTKSLPSVDLSVKELDEHRVLVKLKRGSEKEDEGPKFGNLNITKSDNPVMVEIKKNDTTLFTTAKGPLIMSETYWEWTIYLTKDSLYGLGETQIKLEKGTNLSKVIYPNKFNHNTPPVIWAKQGDTFHGVIIRHDGPLEITILSSNLIVLRGLTPSDVEIEFALGTNLSFLRQLQNNFSVDISEWDELVKTHLCRGSNELTLSNLIDEYTADIDELFDVECIHENLLMAMMHNDTNGLEDLKNITKALLTNKEIYLSIPPHIYGIENELFVTANKSNMLYTVNNKVYNGKFKGQNVAYPDFSSGSVKEYLISFETLISRYFGINEISGFILTKNWPDNENEELGNLNNFPYLSEDLKSALTYSIPWYATNAQFQHITLHNKYGENMAKAFKDHFPNKVVISSSNMYGNFKPSVVENVDASWSNLKQILKNILFNSMIGNYLVYYPTCGSTASFESQLQESLCMRWYLIAATLPGFSVNSVKPRRNPNKLYTKFTTEIVQRAMDTRKSMIPLYKTILKDGKPLVTPMFYYYSKDPNTFSLNEQYMLGENILVAHPFLPNPSSLMVYFPAGFWYGMSDGQFFNVTEGRWEQLSIVETDWISYISGGSIIPFVENDSKLTIIIATSCESNKIAEGKIFFENKCEAVLFATTKNITITMKAENVCRKPYEVNRIKLYDCGNFKHISASQTLNEANDTVISFNA
ncbi:unnamed protein product [Brassicogethes aeneus]|uniref:P-type domain-containing protein n=1 Tax=Brassicogethes aeneus TaxID=1431903 RepID=A0A9P0FHF8_BRAAE|nr:unnamed protein product [Brassicogethes aeneus]